jgi:hypothetical protein
LKSNEYKYLIKIKYFLFGLQISSRTAIFLIFIFIQVIYTNTLRKYLGDKLVVAEALKKDALKAEALPRRNTKPSRKDNSFTWALKKFFFYPTRSKKEIN